MRSSAVALPAVPHSSGPHPPWAGTSLCSTLLPNQMFRRIRSSMTQQHPSEQAAIELLEAAARLPPSLLVAARVRRELAMAVKAQVGSISLQLHQGLSIGIAAVGCGGQGAGGVSPLVMLSLCLALVHWSARHQ